MTQKFQENTVAIILNEMFNDSKKLKTQMQFDALTEAYAARIVKLFAIPDVSNNEVAVCKNKKGCSAVKTKICMTDYCGDYIKQT